MLDNGVMMIVGVSFGVVLVFVLGFMNMYLMVSVDVVFYVVKE